MKTNQNYKIKERIENIPFKNYDLLRGIMNKLDKVFHGQREIMYSDIINSIIREGNIGEKYNDLILWCNYKIRLGESIIEI
ncbi:MAG: hypothetical protein ACXADU_08445 [Promethearchaeota archaeon]|jgi:hypothetical protein